MTTKDLAEALYPNVKISVEEIMRAYPPRSLPAGCEVTRFAPSPTGSMHIGHLFSAIIDHSLARGSNGVFYLRNEDTDKKREVKGSMEVIFDYLLRFGQAPDEYQKVGQKPVGKYGPYIQSLRLDIYHAFAKKLVAEGNAFPCFCQKTEGKEEILKAREERFSEDDSNVDYDPCRNMPIDEAIARVKNGEKFAIRLKTPNDGTKKCVFEDIVKGRVELPENAKDVILVKNDGIPPYAFAHAIDDTLMGTTVVVRGEEWFTSTPAHIDIFNALGFKPIKYYHTPNICKIDENGNKRKLSKRKDPESSISYFFEMGYLETAVIEYILNLISSSFEPWRAKNPDLPYTDFKFTLKSITAVSPLFDFAKLNDISKNLFARMSAQQVFDGWLKWAETYNKPLAEKLKKDEEKFVRVCNIDREKPKPRKDIYAYGMIEQYYDYVFAPPTHSELEEGDKALYKEFVTAYAKDFKLPTTKEEWFDGVKALAQTLGYATDNKLFKENPQAFKGNTAKACEFIRLALTGRKNSPDLYEIMLVLGEDEVKRRLK